MVVVEPRLRDPSAHSTKCGVFVSEAVVIWSEQTIWDLTVCVELSRGLPMQVLLLLVSLGGGRT